MHRRGVGTVAAAVPERGTDATPAGVTATNARWKLSGWTVLAAATAACAGAVVAASSGPGAFALVGLYTAVIAGTAVFVTRRERRAATAAVLEERRRIARNIHDGLAQELAYIRMETSRMASLDATGRASRVALAAQRALEESRRAISALCGDSDEPFAAEFSAVANRLANRAGARISVRIEPGVEVLRERREALMRIMREAVSNGVRHGRATELALELTAAQGVKMAVRDNGAGFAPGGPRRTGSFGLTSMRERAESVGGDMTVQSTPGGGTVVEVRLP
jgi:signal transduction histidine kinase